MTLEAAFSNGIQFKRTQLAALEKSQRDDVPAAFGRLRFHLLLGSAGTPNSVDSYSAHATYRVGESVVLHRF